MQWQDIGSDLRAIIIPHYGIKDITSTKMKVLLETIPKGRVKSAKMFRSICNFLSFLLIILRANFSRENCRSRIAHLRDRMFVSGTSSCEHPATRFQGILLGAFFFTVLSSSRAIHLSRSQGRLSYSKIRRFAGSWDILFELSKLMEKRIILQRKIIVKTL